MRAETRASSLIYQGVDGPSLVRHPLRAGPLSLIYEGGEIRYVTFGAHEVIRRVYVTVRDEHWGTILPEVSNLEISTQGESFELAFNARHQRGNIDFGWRGRVTGDPRGVVKFSMEGRANSTFRQSRVGLCVLHPIRDLVGTACFIEHSDGSRTQGEFPPDVSPHQPFMDIRAITQRIADKIDATVHFEGAVFEMEDQRNWTDGSFKTYSPPLSVPYPSEMAEGTAVAQSARIEPSSFALDLPIQVSTSGPVLSLGTGARTVLPEIGFASASGCGPLTGKQLERARLLEPGHLRVDLGLSERDHVALLESAWQEAMALRTKLHVGLVVSDGSQLQELLRALERVKPSVGAWLVFDKHGHPADADLIKHARKHLLKYDVKALIGTGSNLHFAELNRQRSITEEIDLVCYPASPQIHGSDNDTLIEALEGQNWTVASAKKFADDLPVFVTPITLKPRHCADTIDPRQASLFGAAWTLGSLKYLTEGGVLSVTYFETQGARGIQAAQSERDDTAFAHVQPDSVFPVYHVLADACEFAGAQVIPIRATEPLKVEGIALRKGNTLRLLCANFTQGHESVVIEGFPVLSRNVRWWRLDDQNAAQAMQSPEEFRVRPALKLLPAYGNVKVDLPSFAIARIEAEVES